MADVLQVYNQALSAVGTRTSVSDPDEASPAAEVCTLWYTTVRDQVLRAAPWPAARSAQRLSVLVERDSDEDWQPSDPAPGWTYAYALPSDFLYPRHLATWERFELGTVVSDNRHALMTNVEDALLVYTSRQEQVAMWDVDMRLAIVYALAAHIAMPLHGKPDRAKWAMEQANSLILEARVRAANMDSNTFDTIPEWLSARGYGGGAPQGRYMYQYGSMIAVADVV